MGEYLRLLADMYKAEDEMLTGQLTREELESKLRGGGGPSAD